MHKLIRKAYDHILSFDPEFHKMMDLIAGYTKTSSRLLDVGCGYGRYLKTLKSCGYEVSGVDANQDIVKTLNQEGYSCYNPSDFEKLPTEYDTLLMAHIIEHFTPHDLMQFMDNYLNRLKVGGYLFICTPLYSNYFYDDFDHVKPYHPSGLQMVFGENSAQVQYQSQNKLKLVDLWFRRSPLMPRLVKGAYLNTPYHRLQQIGIFAGYLAYHVSFGMIGKKDGWIGVYQKVGMSI